MRWSPLIIGFVFMLGLVARVGSSIRSDEASVTGSTAPACPDEAARWLPSDGEGAELVARYDTGEHVVTICRDYMGSYHYDGQLKGKPVTADNHISLAAERTSNGFTAVNGDYRYVITGPDLTVSYRGKVLSEMHLTPIPS
ncbi:hypothetical protein [Amycolatopsis sp. NPDC001319]|uniref:hypothetical protein n=1 Tax=unclassified Amycolatopsis TaxID=2618356 RepID=UPI00368371BE